jgi:four helix bundle protein
MRDASAQLHQLRLVRHERAMGMHTAGARGACHGERRTEPLCVLLSAHDRRASDRHDRAPQRSTSFRRSLQINLQLTIYNLQSDSRSRIWTRRPRFIKSPRVYGWQAFCSPHRMTVGHYAAYGQDLRERAFWFACRVVRLSDEMWKCGGVARILAPQIVGSGTSVGANLEEARGGESRRDFASKCAISLKEAREVHYRLRVAPETGLAHSDEARSLAAEAGELSASRCHCS